MPKFRNTAPFSNRAAFFPPPPPSYGIHMLEQRPIFFPDGTVQYYLALPLDYHHLPPPHYMDERFLPKSPSRSFRCSPRDYNYKDREFYGGRGRQQQQQRDPSDSLGFDGRGKECSKRKFVEQERGVRVSKQIRIGGECGGSGLKVADVDSQVTKNEEAQEKKENLEEGKAGPAPLQRLPCGRERKGKLLVLDLNGILADIVGLPPNGYKPDYKFRGKSVFKRPFCEDFLKFCFERFDVGVWSSRIKKNVDDVVNFLMGDLRHQLLFCWDNSQCTKTDFTTTENKHKPVVFKELKKLWEKQDPELPWESGEYNESNTVLLDDSPYKAVRNPPCTAIFPCSFTLYDQNDNALGPLGDVRVYLEQLAMAEDFQKYIQQHPFGQCQVSPPLDF